jgi:hypothetical protein
MNETDNDPAPLNEPQLIPSDDDPSDAAPDLPDQLERDDDDEIREPGI